MTDGTNTDEEFVATEETTNEESSTETVISQEEYAKLKEEIEKLSTSKKGLEVALTKERKKVKEAKTSSGTVPVTEVNDEYILEVMKRKEKQEANESFLKNNPDIDADRLKEIATAKGMDYKEAAEYIEFRESRANARVPKGSNGGWGASKELSPMVRNTMKKLGLSEEQAVAILDRAKNR